MEVQAEAFGEQDFYHPQWPTGSSPGRGRGLGFPSHHLLAPLDSNPNVVIIHLGKKKTSLLLIEQDLLRPLWGDLAMQFYERVKKAALEFGIS